MNAKKILVMSMLHVRILLGRTFVVVTTCLEVMVLIVKVRTFLPFNNRMTHFLIISRKEVYFFKPGVWLVLKT